MEKIRGGAFVIARQIFSSEFWLEKPCSWKIIWVFILGNVNHKDSSKLRRGEGFFDFASIHRRIGSDITEDMIKKFLRHGRRLGMLSTTRSTRGTIIKVLKYDKFQSLGNYTSTEISTGEAREKHERSTPINKNVKNDKNVKNTLSKDKEAKPRRANPCSYSLLPNETMSPIDDRDRSFPRKRVFGNEKIDWTLDYLEHKLGRNLAGQERWNRIYANHLAKKYGIGTVKKIIDWLGEPDNWWYAKISQISTVYKNADRFLAEMALPPQTKSRRERTIEESIK